MTKATAQRRPGDAPSTDDERVTVDPTLKVEAWETHKVKPYGKNPREIPERAVQKVARSIKKYGWRQPLVVDEKGEIIVGHTRLLAAKFLGLQKVPVHVATGLSVAEKRAYRIMDNKSATESGWNFDLLVEELKAIGKLGFDLEDAGFSPGEFDALVNAATMTQGESEAAFGTGDDEEMWPSIELQVPPKVKATFDSLMERVKGKEDHLRFGTILDLAQRQLGGHE